MRNFLLAWVFALVGLGPGAAQERIESLPLLPGDLLFYRDTTGMGAAVSESTGHYTHVAMVESVGDTVWLIDATPRFGVSRRPLRSTLVATLPHPDPFRLAVGFDTVAVLARARALLGCPYDEAFLPDNGAYYCSELIYECYRDADGAPLFHARPMNWRRPDGTLPRYWKRHFRRLRMPVPEGVVGTNPTDLAREPLLRPLQPAR